MIRLDIQVWGGDRDSEPNLHGKHVFDATPWFAQATPRQLNMVEKCELESFEEGTDPAFGGEPVAKIAKWLARKGFIPSHFAPESLNQYCDQWYENTDNYGTYLYLINATDFRQWRSSSVAQGAVDTLLGESDQAQDFMQDFGKTWHCKYAKHDTGYFYCQWYKGMEKVGISETYISETQIKWLEKYVNWLDGVMPFDPMRYDTISEWMNTAKRIGWTAKYVRKHGIWGRR